MSSCAAPDAATPELYRDDEPWEGPGSSPSAFVGDVSGVVDLRTDEIRMTVPLQRLGSGLVTRGTKVTGFGGYAQHRQLQVDHTVPPYWRSVMGHHQDRISARRGVTYPAGAPSCVKVPR